MPATVFDKFEAFPFSGTGNDENCFLNNIIQTEVNLFLAGFTHLEPLCGVSKRSNA